MTSLGWWSDVSRHGAIPLAASTSWQPRGPHGLFHTQRALAELLLTRDPAAGWHVFNIGMRSPMGKVARLRSCVLTWRHAPILRTSRGLQLNGALKNESDSTVDADMSVQSASNSVTDREEEEESEEQKETGKVNLESVDIPFRRAWAMVGAKKLGILRFLASRVKRILYKICFPNKLRSGTILTDKVADALTMRQYLANSSKTHTSTVALVPPESVWAPIQAARTALCDKGIYRWPPHINLLYPFVPAHDFAAAVALLSPALANMVPPRITLDALDCFGGRSRGVLYCHPSSAEETAALQELQAALQNALPCCNDQQREGIFTPHMTITHFESRDAAEAAKSALLANWTPVTFTCAESVHVMKRAGDAGQFERACTLKFGATSPPSLFEPLVRFETMPREEADWIRQARKDSKRPGGKNKRRRRPRRSAEERAAIQQRTPEEIAEIRAQRAAKRAQAESEATSEKDGTSP